MGVFKDVIVETLPGKEFLDKYNIDIVTVLTVLLALVILLVIVEFFQEKEEHKLNSQDDKDSNIALNKDKQQLKLKSKLLSIVETEVNSRLEQSLHNRVYIVLNKDKDLNQVENPYEMDVKVGNKAKVRLKNTEITKVYDQPEVAGRLLILGQPGSGKTTMLLKLSEELIKRAKKYSTQPIPLLFSLPTWKDDKQSIKDWLVEQLKEKYGVRKDIGKQLLDSQEIIPLLDGLDELAAECQELCVNKINQFLKPENWSNPIVVCSRTQEYQNYQSLLQLNTSLELCPYTPQQVYKYLKDTNNEELWKAISSDANLSTLATTPLLLNIIILASQEISVEKWQKFQSTDERLDYLLDAYVNKMFKRSYKNKQPPQDKTKRYLGWLAQRLIEEDSTEFFIEKIQPYWLKNKLQIVIYNLVVWGVIEGIIMGLTLGLIYKLIYGLISGVNYGLAYKLFLGISIIFGFSGFFNLMNSFPEFFRLIYGLSYGVTIGSVIGIANGFFGEQIEKNIEKIIIQISPSHSISKVLVKWQIYGLIASLATGLIFWLISNIYKLSELTEFSGIYGLNFIIIYALISGLLYGSISGFIGDNIQTMESLKFRIKTYFYGLITGLILGLTLGLVFGLIYKINYGITYGLIYGTIIGMTIGTLFGIDGIEIENKRTPNQGIRQSFINTLATSINTCLFTIPANFIILTIAFKDKEVLVTSLISGIFLGLLIGITRCGTPAIKHFILRLVLYSNGYTPWNYAKFLDYCTNRLFLQRVGGSYRFMHDLLRQHFAKKYAQ